MNPHRPCLTLISLYFIKTNSEQQSQLSPEDPKWERRGLLPVPDSVGSHCLPSLVNSDMCFRLMGRSSWHKREAQPHPQKRP